MKKFVLSAGLALLLVGCASHVETFHGDAIHEITSGIDLKVEKGDYEPACFFDTRPTKPTDLSKAEFQYVAFRFFNGQFQRMTIRGRKATTLQTANDNGNFSGADNSWETILANSVNTDFVPLPNSNVPPRPQRRNFPRQPPGNSQLPLYPTPLNAELHYYTKLTFILVDDDWEFNGAGSPFQVAAGTGGKLSPFSNLTSLTRNGTMFTVDYYNARDTENDGLADDCVYEYLLHTVGDVNNIQFYTTIDPKTGGDDSPPPGG